MVLGVLGVGVALGAKKELICSRCRGMVCTTPFFFLGGPSPMSLPENPLPKYQELGCGQCLAVITSGGDHFHDRVPGGRESENTCSVLESIGHLLLGTAKQGSASSSSTEVNSIDRGQMSELRGVSTRL